MTPASRELTIGLASAFGVVCMWTSFQLISRAGAQSTLTPYDLATLRFGIGAIVVLPFAWRMGLGTLKLWQAAVLAIFAGPGFTLLAFVGYTFASTAHGAAILSGTVSVFSGIFGWIVLRERLSALQMGGLAVLLLGVALVTGGSIGGILENQWIGDLMFLSAAASWAVFAVFARKWRVSAMRATFVTALISAAIFVPIHVVFLPSNFAGTSWLEIAGYGFYQGILSMILSMLLFTRAVEALGPTMTSILAASVPATATLLGWWLLDETVNDITLIGVGAVTVGIAGAAVGSEIARRKSVSAARLAAASTAPLS